MVRHEHLLDASNRFLQPGFLSSHLEGYLQDLERRGYTPLTAKFYADSVCHFGQWAQTQRLTLEDLSDEVLSRFAKHRCRCPGARRNRAAPR